MLARIHGDLCPFLPLKVLDEHYNPGGTEMEMAQLHPEKIVRHAKAI